MRALLVGLLLLAALLSGCTGGTTDPTTPPAPGPIVEETPEVKLVAPTLLPDLLLDGNGAGEPNIWVAADGTIYGADPGINIWRSQDAGKSYARQPASGITGGGDGDIATTDSGRLHWLGLFGADDKPIPYQFSDDGGKTFSPAVDLSNGTGADREWLDARPDGTIYTSWRDSDDGGIIATRTSHDDGATWGPRVKMADDAIGGPIVHGPAPGTVYEAMTTFGDESADPLGLAVTGGSSILLARSADDGATWEVVPVYDPAQSAQFGLIGMPTSIFPVVAADDAGTLYVVFSADSGQTPAATPKPAARFGVYLTSSKDNGDTWSAPVLLSDPSKVALMPFVAAGAAGRVAVVWYENTLGMPADALPDAWNVRLWESIDADVPAPASVTALLNAEPNHIGAVCTAGTGCLASDRSLLDFFEVAIQPNGLPVAIWSSSVAGTGVGVAAQGTDVHAGGVAAGTPLR